MSSTESPEAALAAVPLPPSGPRAGEGESVRVVSLPGLTLTVRSREEEDEGLAPALFVHGLGARP